MLSGTTTITDSSAGNDIKYDRRYLTHSLVVQSPERSLFPYVLSVYADHCLPWSAYSPFYLPPTSCVGA